MNRNTDRQGKSNPNRNPKVGTGTERAPGSEIPEYRIVKGAGQIEQAGFVIEILRRRQDCAVVQRQQIIRWIKGRLKNYSSVSHER